MSSSGPADSTTLLGAEDYAASADEAWAPGRAIGRYSLIRELGRGGMGVVYRAYDSRLRREVALKLLHRRGDARARQRIVREAQAMARISDPHVVAVYDVQEHDDGVVFIAMELVEGRTVAQRIIAIHDAVPGDRINQGLGRFLLARASWEAEPDRARELAREALAIFEAQGRIGEHRRAEVQAWLADR